MFQSNNTASRQLFHYKYLLLGKQLFRSLIFQFYKGDRYQCIICEKKLRNFISVFRATDKICPSCGSRSRDRRLWLVLRPFVVPNTRILHLSPNNLSLSQKLRHYPGIHYTAADAKGRFPADRQLDITSLDLPSKSFDLIICYYVLEQVEQDKKAIQELMRVLQPGGKCFIQSPFKKGMIYEDPDKNTPTARKYHFGSESNVRIYSVDGLKARLQNTGFDVVATRFVEQQDNYHGLLEEEYVVTALKH